MARASNFSPVLDDVRGATQEVSDLTHVFVRARVSRVAQPFGGSLERLCALTPYAVELIADDALRAGRGARLELLVAANDGDEDLVSLLDTAADETDAALEELRGLAHGIYPAILTEAGLGPALETLADEAPLPVELRELPAERAALAVERTAYVVVDEAIGDAAGRGAEWLRVRVRREAGRLVVAVDDDGAPRGERLVHMRDRVGALGGSLAAGENTLRAEIPCE